jgi:diaminohydroxyphosphoribosylaminopyrimidine deaminase/5-amino-6-(5-phosphoribosylamino)uracil reductase
MSMNVHANHMSLALKLAERGKLSVSPNPMVGCVIVKDTQVIGQGYHQYAGGPHAEVYALQEAGERAQGATAYVNLEPCCHHGKTPPCTTALIKAGIKKVYVATQDPFPLVAGKGIETLQNAGIEVEVGLYQSEAKLLNEIFFHYVTTKRPFVIAKWAMSLDGKTTTNTKDDRNISSQETQQTAHLIRQQVDAILIGANTATLDNPRLTARPNTQTSDAVKQPIRIVLSTHGDLPLDLTIFDSNLPSQTIVATTCDADKNWLKALADKKIDVLLLPKNADGQINLPDLLDELGNRAISSLLVEGGMTLHQNFLQASLVNKIHVYLAPVIIGSMKNKISLQHITSSHINHDLCLTANLEEKSYV